jgi:hypothetical protein
VALDMKSSEKNDRAIQKTMEGLPSRLKQAKDRISEDRIWEDVQAKGMCNIFNKIITENFPNLEKTMPIQVQETKLFWPN